MSSTFRCIYILATALSVLQIYLKYIVFPHKTGKHYQHSNCPINITDAESFTERNVSCLLQYKNEWNGFFRIKYKCVYVFMMIEENGLKCSWEQAI